jgi:hypothetical protein
MNPNCLVPGRLIEFSFDSFVEFGREKLQSHDSGAPDDFLRHAGDHVVSQLRERGRDRFHAASNAESPGDSLAMNARPRPFDSLRCGNPDRCPKCHFLGVGNHRVGQLDKAFVGSRTLSFMLLAYE